MFTEMMMGAGGGLNPSTVYNPVYNTNDTGVAISVTRGKTYYATFDNRTSTKAVTISNANVIFEEVGNGVSWGGTLYRHIVIFKAQSSTITITDSANGVWGVILTQLD